jgi:hypothetical protein
MLRYRLTALLAITLSLGGPLAPWLRRRRPVCRTRPLAPPSMATWLY